MAGPIIIAPTTPVERIRSRLAEDRALYKHYLAHAHKMLEREDLHGLWDAAVNASEVSNRIDAAEEALRDLGETWAA